MYYSSADFSGLIRQKGKSRKTFNIVMFKNLCFVNFIWGVGCSPVAPILLGCAPRLPVPWYFHSLSKR